MVPYIAAKIKAIKIHIFAIDNIVVSVNDNDDGFDESIITFATNVPLLKPTQNQKKSFEI